MTSIPRLAVILLCLAPFISISVSQEDLPTFITHPTSQDITSGTNVTLNCTVQYAATGINLTYMWTVNDTLLALPNGSYSLVGHFLMISGFTSQHNGNYSCLVSNGVWTVKSNYANLQLIYIESEYNQGSTEITVKENDHAIIDCIPSYRSHPYPITDVSWRLIIYNIMQTLSLDLSSSKNSPVVGSNGSLYLRQVTTSETYRCTINSLLYSTTVAVSGTIDPPPSPILLAAPTDIIVNKNEYAALSCIAGGLPLPTINWKYPVNLTEFLQPNPSVLYILNVGTDKVGIYQCNATGIGTYNALLTVRNSPSVTTLFTSPYNITFGDPLTVSCTVTGINITWSWYRNGVRIPSETSSNLVINSTDLSSAGAYQCFATNPAGSDSATILVNIHTIPPVITSGLRDILAFNGKEFSLKCEAYGAPFPIYEWMKDGIQLASNDGIDLSQPGCLTLKSVSVALQGNYTCVAKSFIDDIIIGISSTTAELIVSEPTAITSYHIPSVSVSFGESFTMNCTAIHDSLKTAVNIIWVHNGSVVSTNDHISLISTGQTSLGLVIHNAVYSDHGTYQCIVNTILNANPSLVAPTVNSSITLINITDALVLPVISNVRSPASDIVEISWTYSGFLANVLTFTINIQVGEEVNDDNWYNLAGINVTAFSSTQKNITNLQPYTTYWVRVAAVLRNTDKIALSSPVSIRTKEDVPSGAPLNVNAFSQSKTSLELRWEPPMKSTHNGIITEYTISYWTVSNKEHTNISTGSNSTRYTLTRLEAGTTYWISVAAHTSVGRGPFSTPINSTYDPNIGGIGDSTDNTVHDKIWFIFLMAVVALIIVIIVVTVIATVRWNIKRKGRKYPVSDDTYQMGEQTDFGPDIVADYENRKKLEPLDLKYMDENESESSQGTYQPSFTYATYAPSNDGSTVRLGIPAPPSYINPPSFEDTLKAKLNKRRSASMSLLEKAERMRLDGSGWSLGHDPKSAFSYIPDDTSSIEKTRLQIPDDNSNSSGSRYPSITIPTNNATLATFV